MIFLASGLFVAAAGLGLGLYLMIAAHGVRRESDRTLQRALADAARERAELAGEREMLLDRMMQLSGHRYLDPAENGHRELTIPDPWGAGVDPNVEEGPDWRDHVEVPE